MTDLGGPYDTSLDKQIAELDREIKLRRRVYPRWVAAEKISPREADLHMARIVAARATLARVGALAMMPTEAEPQTGDDQ